MPGRRGVLLGAATAVLGAAGCSAEPGTVPAPGTGTAGTTATGTGTGMPGTAPGTATVTATATATGPAAVPAREEIVARYRSVRPTAWSLAAPGVRSRLGPGAGEHAIALTFDACGGPRATSSGCGYDRDLIALLRRHQARATLFLNGRWIAANPGPTRELIDDPLFEIGNHGTRHLPLSVNGRSAYGEHGTADVGQVYDEIMTNRRTLAGLTGHAPHTFRPGTAFCDDVAVRIAADLGVTIIGFSVNGDAGTTFTRAQIGTALAAVRAGDIVISHVNRPEHQTAEGYRDALPRLLDRGLRTVTLSQAAL